MIAYIVSLIRYAFIFTLTLWKLDFGTHSSWEIYSRKINLEYGSKWQFWSLHVVERFHAIRNSLCYDALISSIDEMSFVEDRDGSSLYEWFMTH